MWLFVMFLVTAIATAFYTGRMLFLTFYGPYRGHAEPHESPGIMTGPLVILAGATIVAGFLGSPFTHYVFADWVHFGEPEVHSFHGAIAAIGSVAALGGLALGWLLYGPKRDRAVDPIERGIGPVWGVLQHRYYIDDFYFNGIVRPIRDTVSAGVYWFNQNVLDGAVNGATVVARGGSGVIMWIDRTIIDGAVNGTGTLMESLGKALRRVQSGKVQWYAVGLFAGVIVLSLFVFNR
jgi:NADH-quinone oxidoreductase subunit L